MFVLSFVLGRNPGSGACQETSVQVPEETRDIGFPGAGIKYLPEVGTGN